MQYHIRIGLTVKMILTSVVRFSGSRPAIFEAIPAKDRPALRRTEGNCGFTPALRTDRSRLHSPRRRSALARTTLPFGFAILAPLGLVLEILIVVKLLLARGKDEIRTAVHTL